MLNIQELSFHDVYILNINLNTKKDFFDQIKIFLKSADFIPHLGTDKVILEFSECYKANLQLQMWIGGKDTIRELRFMDSSDELSKINEMKEKGLIRKEDSFKHCEIILNTSSSKIDILAKEVKLEKFEESFSHSEEV
jgi:hypothetical protein